MNRKVGKLLNERRTALGLSLEEVANRVGVNHTSLFRWEKGETRTIRSSHLMKLADTLGFTIEELILAEEPKGDPNIIKYKKEIERELELIDNVDTLKQIKRIIKTFTRQ